MDERAGFALTTMNVFCQDEVSIIKETDMKTLIAALILSYLSTQAFAQDVNQETVVIQAGSKFVHVRATLATVSGCKETQVPLLVKEELLWQDQSLVFTVSEVKNQYGQAYLAILSKLKENLDEETYGKVLSVLAPFTNTLPDPNERTCRALVPIFGDILISVEGMDGKSIVINTPADWERIEVNQLIIN